MQKERGMTFIGLVLMVAGALFIAIIAMKLIPAYIEFFSVKKAISKISDTAGFNEMSKKDIADSFEKSATIDDISSIKAKDLIVTKNESGKQVVRAEYQKVVPLVANVSALLDFSASTDKSNLLTSSEPIQ